MLSIIIISKNEEKTLPRLLESIKKQDFEYYEIILSDANSTDKTRAIAKSYGCRIIEGGIPSRGRNNGAKAAKGDILLFLDSDVRLPLGFLRENLGEFNKKNLGIGAPLQIIVSEKLSIRIISLLDTILRIFTQFFLPSGPGFCIFCKKDLFHKINGFDEKTVSVEDQDFVIRCSKFGKFRVLNSKRVYNDARRFEREGTTVLLAKIVIFTFRALFLREKIKYSRISYEQQGVNITQINKKV